MPLKQLAEAVDRAEAARTVEELLGEVLARLSGGKWVASLRKFLRERMRVERVHVFDGSVRVVSVKSGFIAGNFCSSLDDYDRALNAIGAPS